MEHAVHVQNVSDVSAAAFSRSKSLERFNWYRSSTFWTSRLSSSTFGVQTGDWQHFSTDMPCCQRPAALTDATQRIRRLNRGQIKLRLNETEQIFVVCAFACGCTGTKLRALAPIASGRQLRGVHGFIAAWERRMQSARPQVRLACWGFAIFAPTPVHPPWRYLRIH